MRFTVGCLKRKLQVVQTTSSKVLPKDDASPSHLLETPTSLHHLRREPRPLTLTGHVTFKHVTFRHLR